MSLVSLQDRFNVPFTNIDLWNNISQSNNQIETFWEIYELIDEQYFWSGWVDSWAMRDNAYKWFVDWLNDPYTVYMDKVQSSWFKEELKWQTDFEWIGAVVAKKSDWIMIEEVIKNSPAFTAGLQPLDLIVQINWSWTENLSLSDAVSMIRWPKWTKVTLTIVRTKQKKPELSKFEVTRWKISLPSVNHKILTTSEKHKIAHIEISIIWEETETLMKQTIAEISKENIEGLIIDLRWNGWWFLPIAVEIASHFVPQWEVIVSSKYRSLPEETYRSKWYNEFSKKPIIVMIDWMTASAWEIIALALRDNLASTLVWTKTFGKWSIQTVDELSNWATLKYTIWKRYSPLWDNIDHIGINPDVVVELDIEKLKETQIDNQLLRAQEELDRKLKK